MAVILKGGGVRGRAIRKKNLLKNLSDGHKARGGIKGLNAIKKKKCFAAFLKPINAFDGITRTLNNIKSSQDRYRVALQ